MENFLDSQNIWKGVVELGISFKDNFSTLYYNKIIVSEKKKMYGSTS